MSGALKFLFGGNARTVTPDYTGLQIQTAVNTLPIPIVWGMSKVAPNLIWYNAFAVYAGSSGGKGSLFGGGSGSPTTYSASIIMALCEGAIAGINMIWKGQSVSTLAGLGFTLFAGTQPQTPWSYVTSSYPTQALGYEGTAYVAAANYSLGDTATIDNHNFEVEGLRYGSGYSLAQFQFLGSINGHSAGIGTGYGYVDADPALIVADFLTNAQFGVGFPAGSIDGTSLYTGGGGNDAAYQTYCRAVGLALSPALIDQEQASSILDRWLKLTNTAAVWSGGLLRFLPYGDGAIANNGVTFTPNVTPIYNLADDDFKVEKDQDPLQVSRSDPYAAYNVWRLECADRTNAYNLTSVESRDQNAIELYGMRIAPTFTAHEVADIEVGSLSGQLMLQRSVYIRNTYKFTLSWEYCLLDPMDLVTVTDSILGLSYTAIRLTDIEEDENGFLSVTAEEFPLGVATAVLYPTANSSGGTVNREVVPDPVNTPIIFEPPSALVGSAAQLWIAASGGVNGTVDPNWGGANVWVSLDNTTYTQIGQITAPAKMGPTTAALGSFSGSNPDTADTLSVNLTESAGALGSVSQAVAAAAAQTLCVVDDAATATLELLSYETATLGSAYNYGLTTLYRGLYGTTGAAHANGAPFALLDAAIFKYDLATSYVGKTLYIKLQSFNVFGGGLEDISTCAVWIYTTSGLALDHPVAESMLTGTPLDFGLVTYTVATSDDFGVPPTLAVEFDVDLGPA